MRFGLWWLALIPLACGKSASRSDQAGTNGTGGSALAGVGGGSGSAGEAGRSETGGSSAAGASSMAGSSSGAVGGSAAGASGNGATGGGGAGGSASGSAGDASAGEAGDGGGAGTPGLDCQGRYSVCGCGCCGGEPASSGCYYPEQGDDLSAIRAEDQMAAMSPSCATVGCSAGVHLVCCEAPEPEPATYRLAGYSQDAPYLGFSRTGEDGRCSSLTIGRLGADRSGFPIYLPDRWALDDTSDGRCDSMMGAPLRAPIGALGFVSQMPPGYCNYHIDLTLFFLADNGEVDPVRFTASGLSPQGYTTDDRCP